MKTTFIILVLSILSTSLFAWDYCGVVKYAKYYSQDEYTIQYIKIEDEQSKTRFLTLKNMDLTWSFLKHALTESNTQQMDDNNRDFVIPEVTWSSETDRTNYSICVSGDMYKRGFKAYMKNISSFVILRGNSPILHN